LALAMAGTAWGAAPPIPSSALPKAVRDRLLSAHKEWLAASRDAKAGKLAEARKRAGESFALQRGVLGDQMRTAAQAWQLAIWHEAADDWPAARRDRALATAILSRLLGPDHHRVRDARNAEADSRNAEKLGPEGRARLGRVRRAWRQAMAEAVKGDLAKALPVVEKAVADLPALVGKDHPEVARALEAQAWLLREMGELHRCEPLLVRARAILRASMGERHPDHAASVQNLAALWWSLRDYRRAEPLFLEALAVQKTLVGEEDIEYARMLANLAQLLKDTGRYARSREMSLRALEIRRALLPPGDPDVLMSLHNLAGLLIDLGDLAGALERYEQVLALRRQHRGKDHPETADTLNNLADLHRRLGEPAKARALCEEALGILQKRFGPRHPLTTTTRSNLATLLMDLGETDRAEEILEQTLKQVRERSGLRHPDHAQALNNLAALHWSKGEPRRALPLFEKSLALREESLGQRAPEHATAVENVGVQHLALGDARRAEPLMRRALSRTHRHLEDSFAVLSERQRLALLAQLKGSLHVYLSAAKRADAPASLLYEQVLAWKGAVAARADEERALRDEPAQQPLVLRLQGVRVRMAQLGAAAPAPADAKRWLDAFKRLETEKEQIEADLAKASAEFRRLRAQRRIVPADIAAALPEGVGLIDFIEYDSVLSFLPRKGKTESERRLLAFVLRRGQPVRCVDLGRADPIEMAVRAWRAAIQEGEAAPAGAELRRRVWLPAARALGDVSAALVAADGVVSQLPFAALPGARRGTFLIEEIALGHVAAGRDVLPTAGKARAGKGLLALGDPSYGKPGKPWSALPGTRIEADRIAGLRRGAGEEPVVLRGAEASKAGLLRSLGEARPRWLHLATHGFFEPAREPVGPLLVHAGTREGMAYHRNPLLSCGLVLARANEDAAAGRLTAEEIAGLDLRGVELAVLSACETGLGRVAGGEGVLGLQRAFRQAGAGSAVCSLWSVSDAATSVLMEEFYKRLWGKGKTTKLEALRQAQLAVLRRPELVEERTKELSAVRGLRGAGMKAEKLPGGARRSPTAWWAAWQLSGDWR
ncbi:MAG: tetratricopeptide repeat protein, partial [Gemmataceae bacterium]|nr:tetratricopeptide repeat protein [Gemmataceae bacterium]